MKLLALLLPSLALAADYQLCFLEDGPAAGTIEKAKATELQAAHMAHINAMWKQGALESAGPIASLPGSRGIFLFSAQQNEASTLAAKDPKVLAGELKINCQTWQGPAGVGKHYREAYAKPGFKDQMTRKVALLLKTPEKLENVLIEGPITTGPYKHFAVLQSGDLKEAQAKHPQATAFIWFHDPQVWLNLP
jgi:uncharacterized protein YciI